MFRTSIGQDSDCLYPIPVAHCLLKKKVSVKLIQPWIVSTGVTKYIVLQYSVSLFKQRVKVVDSFTKANPQQIRIQTYKTSFTQTPIHSKLFHNSQLLPITGPNCVPQTRRYFAFSRYKREF